MRRTAAWIPLGLSWAIVAGCGGGGGGTSGPGNVALGTFQAATDRTTASTTFKANVCGASAGGANVLIYGDERTGPVNAYTSSHRLTITLYGPVTAGATFPIAATHNAGTAVANYLETANNDGSYVTTGLWSGTTGSITISAATGSHIQGTFTLNTVNTSNNAVIHWTSGTFNVAYETPPSPP